MPTKYSKSDLATGLPAILIYGCVLASRYGRYHVGVQPSAQGPGDRVFGSGEESNNVLALLKYPECSEALSVARH